MNITVLGAGAWGTALAISLAQRHRVTLWARNAQQIAEMRANAASEGQRPPTELAQRRADYETWARKVGWRP